MLMLSPPLVAGDSSRPFLAVVSAPTTIARDSFFEALHTITQSPEHSSSSILRAELSEAPPSYTLAGYSCTRTLSRTIFPRRHWETQMTDTISFFEGVDAQEGEGLVVLQPTENDGDGTVPFYYPQVHLLAFRFLPASSSLQIDLVPLLTSSSSVASSLAPEARLYRTSLGLLTQLGKIGIGLETGYEKRTFHDLLAPKDSVQDLYAVLKGKYNADVEAHSPRVTFRWLLKDWKENTDPAKHVWEDVAIAAWLIVLWRGMYGLNEEGQGRGPPGGFVDVGCGNGLLVFILSSEGYGGYGLDLRMRKSWELYPSTVDLRVQSLDPPSLLSTSSTSFPPGSFLIGNHADELTPWIPLFAALTPGSAYLSIPCCPHALSGKFMATTYSIPPEFLDSLPSAPPPPAPTDGMPAGTRLLASFYAPSPSESRQTGRYFAYQLYLAHLSLICGFLPEREALRMPSTKNFGLVGRVRLGDEVPVRVRVEELVREVVAKGWTARMPEGKGEH